MPDGCNALYWSTNTHYLNNWVRWWISSHVSTSGNVSTRCLKYNKKCNLACVRPIYISYWRQVQNTNSATNNTQKGIHSLQSTACKITTLQKRLQYRARGLVVATDIYLFIKKKNVTKRGNTTSSWNERKWYITKG